MERRNFLKGIVASAVGSTLVVEASPAEVATFGKADTLFAHKSFVAHQPDHRVYDASGNVVGHLLMKMIAPAPGQGFVTSDINYVMTLMNNNSPIVACEDESIGIVRYFKL